MAAGANPDDLYSQYKSGADILIGDLVVNKTTYPDAVLVAPAELTFGHFAKGGLYFIDDKSGKGVADLAANPLGKYSSVATSSSPLIVIGRYKTDGKQTEIKVSEMRTRGDVAFMNVKLTATQAAGESSPVFNMFAKNGGDHNSTSLRLQDCTVDNVAARNFINDVQNPEAAPYSKVVIENCVVKLAREKGNFVVALIRSEASDVQDPTEFVVSNTVAYTDAPSKYATAIHTVKNNPGRVLTLKNNTFVNFGGGQGYIKHGVVASAHIEKNLAAICINKPVGKVNEAVMIIKSVLIKYSSLYGIKRKEGCTSAMGAFQHIDGFFCIVFGVCYNILNCISERCFNCGLIFLLYVNKA